MGKQKQTIMIIGEGKTEFYYFNSLKDCLRNVQLEPTVPKHSNLKELESTIKSGINSGYSVIYCIIDMDNKCNGIEHENYIKLKKRYEKTHEKRKYGIKCEVNFIETHRCTELFFLYYFHYTSKCYTDQPSLLKDLNKHCEYEKNETFFKKSKGLHTYFEKNGGLLKNAIENAQRSCLECASNNRDYTYSQIGEMLVKITNC